MYELEEQPSGALYMSHLAKIGADALYMVMGVRKLGEKEMLPHDISFVVSFREFPSDDKRTMCGLVGRIAQRI